MNTPVYEPSKTFLKELVFESPNTPELFFQGETSANMEINIKVDSKVSDDRFYLVELIVSLRPKISDVLIFGIKLTYATLVKVFDDDVDPEGLEHLLKVVIPQTMYDPLRNLVWKLTTDSGFPPVMMKDFDFANHLANVRKKSGYDIPNDHMLDDEYNDEWDDEEIEMDDDWYDMDSEDLFLKDDVDQPSEGNIFPLSYEWVIEDIRLDPSGATFLEAVKNMFQNDLSTYEKNPLFKYFYRFLTPIEYNHPDYKECDYSYWPLLFQLLFAECKNVTVVGRDGGLPDIEFDYIDGERRTVSSLTIDELKYITSKLAMKAFAHTLVNVIEYIPQVPGVAINDDKLKAGHLILKEELHALFRTDKPGAKQAAVDFVDRLYDCIKHCDSQTIPYKF